MWPTQLSMIPFLPLLVDAAKVTDEVLARAQCQCSVDGTSAGVDVFFWAKRRKTYPSENIRDGGPYRFIGCGAHTFYRDKAEGQVGGYPWRFCYTYGGQAGCTITETSQKYSLNSQIAYRFCSGDYDCDASSNHQVQGGQLIGTETLLSSPNEEETLQDWTNCCHICGQTNGCAAWDFSVETMDCRLFSAFQSMHLVEDSSENTGMPPLWYSGTPGFDDKPLVCWFRNQYETCNDNYRAIFLAATVLGVIGLCFLLLWYMNSPSRGKVLCWTDDVTPGYTRPIVRTRSSKHGSTSYTVTSYSAHLVYRYDGQVYRQTVWMEGKPMRLNKKFFFLANSTGEGDLTPLGHSWLPKYDCCFVFSCVILLSGLMCLFVLSLQTLVTDGGLFQARYVLPGSGVRSVWIATFSLTVLTLLSAAFIIFACVTRGKRCKPKNTYTTKDTRES